MKVLLVICQTNDVDKHVAKLYRISQSCRMVPTENNTAVISSQQTSNSLFKTVFQQSKTSFSLPRLLADWVAVLGWVGLSWAAWRADGLGWLDWLAVSFDASICPTLIMPCGDIPVFNSILPRSRRSNSSGSLQRMCGGLLDEWAASYGAVLLSYYLFHDFTQNRSVIASEDIH